MSSLGLLLLLASSALAGPRPRVGALEAFRGALSARAAGMGGAYVSVADDADALAYNPAGLSRLDHYSSHVYASAGLLTLDRQLNFAAACHRFDGVGTLGVGLLHAGVTGAEGFDASGASTGSFDDQLLGGALAWAGEGGYQFRYGVAVKGVRQQLAGSSASGYGLDLGAWFMPTLGSYLALAVALQDASGVLNWDTARQERPDPLLKIGISDRFFGWRLLLSLDVESALGGQGTVTPRFGAEYWIAEEAALRAGIFEGAASAGATFKLMYYQVDYAFIFDPYGLGGSHHGGVTVKF